MNVSATASSRAPRERLESSHTHGLWGVSAPPAPETASLAADRACEVAIVGAGYTGLSAALHLAEKGVETVVLEAAEIGFGGSGRNVGLVNAGLWVMPDDIADALGTCGEALLALLGGGPAEVFGLIERHAIACEAVRAGTLHCAVGAKGLAELRDRERQWRSRGADVALLSRNETASKVGSRAYSGALLDRRAGTVQPLAYAHGLARAALAAGAVIHTRTPATAARESGGAWRLSTPNGEVRARSVIVATDSYGEGVFRAVRRELVLLPYFNLATPPLPEAVAASILPERQGAWDTREILSSFRFDAANRLVFGSVGALRGTGRAVHEAWALRALRRLFPQLGEPRFESGWYGHIGMTRDNLPRFHRFGERAVSVSGYNGRGIAPGTVFGRLLAGIVSGEFEDGDIPLPAAVSRPVRLRKARQAYYEVGAQLAHFGSDRF